MDKEKDNEWDSSKEERLDPENLDSLDNEKILNWESSVASKSQKKNYGLLGLFLIGLLGVGVIFVLGGKERKSKEGLIQEQESFEPVSKKSIFVPETPAAPPIPENKPLSQEELEKLKKEQALQEARLKSAIVIHQSTNGDTAQASPSSSAEDQTVLTDASGGNTQDPNAKFQQEAQKNSAQGSKAKLVGEMDKIILQGKLIDAVLETAINSDLPGMVRAMVSRDIYAESRNQVLIPRGSRLIGQYNSTIQKGQSRVFAIWNRIIRPDGVEIALNSNGTDPLGRAGLGGRVNNHFWKIFGTSTLLSIIGAGASNGGVEATDQYNSLASYRQEIANSFNQSAQTVLGQYANIPPTIQIKQGTLIKVFVARDLDFSEVLASLPQNTTVMMP